MILEIVSWDSSVPIVETRWCWMSRIVIPPAYRLMIISSRPPSRRDPFGTSCGVKRAVAVPRDRQLDIADLAGDRLRGGAVARVRKQRRLRIAALIANMIGQLHFQATLQGRLQHALQQAVIAAQRHLAGIDLLKDPIQRTGRLQPISQLPLPCAPLGALRVSIVVMVTAVSPLKLGRPLLTQKI